jgi:hypothetical protein
VKSGHFDAYYFPIAFPDISTPLVCQPSYQPLNSQELEAFLRMNDSIKYIRIQCTDYPGVLRTRFIPVARRLEIASGSETIRLA